MQDEPHAAFYRAALHEVITLATDLARRIHAAATQPDPNLSPTLTLDQASIALDRTARILRRSVLLARRLDQPAPAAAPPAEARTQARRHVLRTVEDAIHRVHRDAPDHAAALRTELQDRLDRPDMDADLRTRPVPELIAELARDLGVAVQGRSWVFPRRTPADIDHLLARAARPPATAPAPPRPGTPPPHPAGAADPRPRQPGA